jgi:hypothetical protein
MRALAVVLAATLLALLGACSVKEEKTVQPSPTASAPAAAAPASTTTSKTYSVF